MSGIIFLIVMFCSVPFAIVFLFLANWKLRQRVSALEALVYENSGKIASKPSALPAKVPLKNEQKAASEKALTDPQANPTSPQPSNQAKDLSPAAALQTQAQNDAVKTAGIPAFSEKPPKLFVFSQKNITALVPWIIQNWFYVLSSASLALAGIFLVLYGMEQGVLPPHVRIIAAIIFGGALIGGGEYLRRRYGDDEANLVFNLPSTFSGAGLVVLFGSVLAARLLYGFISSEMALSGLALIGAMALLLGWFYGPVLAAVGVTGAMVAPFIVNGNSDDVSFLLLYFACITAVGLTIDTIRRWAWVSVLTLGLGFCSGFILMLASDQAIEVYGIVYYAALSIAAIVIPVRRLIPDHSGSLLSVTVFARDKTDPWPAFPTRLAGGAIIAATILILITAIDAKTDSVFWASVFILSGLVVALLLWFKNAVALVDLTAVPALALVPIIANYSHLWRFYEFEAQKPEAVMPLTATSVVTIAVLLSIAAAWRSLNRKPSQLFVALLAALIAPAIALTVEVTWQPRDMLGGYIWALHAMAIGSVMVAMAERFARADGPENRMRASFAILSALSCVTFGLVILFSSAALTIAIAFVIVAAAWLDRRYDLPLMEIYILVGVPAVLFRLLVDPGIAWSMDAPLMEMLLLHVATVIPFSGAYILVRHIKRPRSEVSLETAIFIAVGIFVSLMLYRLILSWGGEDAFMSHWSAGLNASIWLALSFAQIKRHQTKDTFGSGRLAIGAIFALIAALQLLFGITVLNPLFGDPNAAVIGGPVFNTLLPAYLLPAVMLVLGVLWTRPRSDGLPIETLFGPLILSGLWFGLTVRHFWRGAEGMSLPGIDQPELYSYTVILLLIGTGLLFQSVARQSILLRKAGMAFIVIAIAKVFLFDIAGLNGLLRVFSFLLLGLALAGLAWLNRWAILHTGGKRNLK
ncbi:DUF2339 domain-containing protein [Rhodobacteraceae bacterium Araon29]